MKGSICIWQAMPRPPAGVIGTRWHSPKVTSTFPSILGTDATPITSLVAGQELQQGLGSLFSSASKAPGVGQHSAQREVDSRRFKIKRKDFVV
jgi:hypothetical protein